MSETTSLAYDQLDKLVYDDRPRSIEALNTYYSGKFDGGYFDSYTGLTREESSPYTITDADINAVALLGMGRVVPSIIRGFATDPSLGQTCRTLLRAIPTDVALHQAPRHMIQPGSPAHQLWSTIRSLNDGKKSVAATKIAARKRPHLLPIVDSEVRTYLGNPENVWGELWAWFQNEQNVAAVQSLRGKITEPLAQTAGGPLSLLRTLDVPMWMIGKQYV